MLHQIFYLTFTDTQTHTHKAEVEKYKVVPPHIKQSSTLKQEAAHYSQQVEITEASMCFITSVPSWHGSQTHRGQMARHHGA